MLVKTAPILYLIAAMSNSFMQLWIIIMSVLLRSLLRSLLRFICLAGLRTIVNALLNSLKMLAEVIVLTLFCIAVFALLALQLYMGALRYKCVQDMDVRIHKYLIVLSQLVFFKDSLISFQMS